MLPVIMLLFLVIMKHKNHSRIEDTSGKTEMSFYIKIFFGFLILGSDLHYKAVPEH